MQRASVWSVRAIVLLLCLATPLATASRAATPEQVDAAVKKAVDYLYAAQKTDNWEEPPKEKETQQGGLTALITYALLAAGERPATSPKLAAAIAYLKQAKMNGVYAIGMRAQVWHLIPHEKDLVVRQMIKRDAEALLACARKPDLTGFRGLFHYTIDDQTSYDSSCSQYGVLGLWALEQSGLEVPDAFWKSVEAAWKKDQQSDGGWNYINDGKHPVSLNMTAAGVATLFITQDYMHGMEGIKCTGNYSNPPLEKGLTWLEKNLPTAKVNAYGMYGVERIGVASGYKYFGKLDWYRAGANRLVKEQQANGSWTGGPGGTLGSTSFCLLFLTRGRAPVVMNKLQYDLVGGGAATAAPGHHHRNVAADAAEGSNWNQRPRDAANVVKYMSKEMERDLNWQIVNLNVDVSDLHDSPILYIAGNQNLKFSAAGEAKLKQFIEEGGIILGHADCADPKFAKSFKELGVKWFKQEFNPLKPEDPIYTRQQFLYKNWRTKPDIEALDNGVRKLMILIPNGDPAKAWQLDDDRDKEDQFQIMADIFLYAVEGKDLREKGDTYIVDANPDIKASQSVTIARLQLGDNYDPEPGGWRRLANIMHNRLSVDLTTKLVKPGKDDLKPYKMAHLTGTGKITINDAARKALTDFTAGGGTLVIDCAGGDTDFNQSIENELARMYPKEAAQLQDVIPMSSTLFSADGKPLEDVQFRSFARSRLSGAKVSQLRGITLGGRLAVIVSREDLSGGLVGESVDGIVGYTPDTAASLMQDIVLFANGITAKVQSAPKAAPEKATPAKPAPAKPAEPKPAAPKPATTKPAAPKPAPAKK